MRHSTLKSVLCALLTILAWTPFSQAQPKKPATAFECRWADTPIKIDGKGDDAAWKHAQMIDDFYLPWLGADKKAKTKTKAKLLWDREYL